MSHCVGGKCGAAREIRTTIAASVSLCTTVCAACMRAKIFEIRVSSRTQGTSKSHLAQMYTRVILKGAPGHETSPASVANELRGGGGIVGPVGPQAVAEEGEGAGKGGATAGASV